MSGKNLSELLERVADWGEVQFPGSTWDSKGRHLVEEAEEARDSEGNGEELADVMMIIAHMARHAGVDLYAEVERKLAICQARKWLPPDEHGVVRHADSPRLRECVVCGMKSGEHDSVIHDGEARVAARSWPT